MPRRTAAAEAAERGPAPSGRDADPPPRRARRDDDDTPAPAYQPNRAASRLAHRPQADMPNGDAGTLHRPRAVRRRSAGTPGGASDAQAAAVR